MKDARWARLDRGLDRAYDTSTDIALMAPSSGRVALPVIQPVSSMSREDLQPLAARLLRLLADPTRRRILLALFPGETCNCELAEALGLAQNLISHHIRQLRQAGFVRERRDPADARWIYYTVDAETYRAAWRSLADAFDPSLIGTRTPSCGPLRSVTEDHSIDRR